MIESATGEGQYPLQHDVAAIQLRLGDEFVRLVTLGHASGRRLHEKAKVLLRLSQELEQNAKVENERVSGTVAIGCLESAAPLYLPALCAGYNCRGMLLRKTR